MVTRPKYEIPFFMNRAKIYDKNDISKLLPGFETVADAIREARYRQIALRNSSDNDCLELAGKIEVCRRLKHPCSSGSCPRCCRDFRRWFYAEASKLCDEYNQACILTVILYDKAMTSREFGEFCPRKLKQYFGEHLRQCGFKDPVIGGLEIDYHPETGLWLPHFHLLVLGNDSPIKTLRNIYRKIESILGRTAKNDRAVRRDKLLNTPEQISYLFKSYWSRIEAYQAPNGKRWTRKLRLKPAELRLSLLVMDRIGFTGRLFLYGVRRTSNGFKVLAENEYE